VACAPRARTCSPPPPMCTTWRAARCGPCGAAGGSARRPTRWARRRAGR